MPATDPLRFLLWPGAQKPSRDGLNPWQSGAAEIIGCGRDQPPCPPSGPPDEPDARDDWRVEPVSPDFSNPAVRVEITASGRSAIARALEGLPSEGDVWIASSVDTTLHRLSPCVAQAIGRRARPTERLTDRTVGVVVVHEWGMPHPRRAEIRELAEKRGLRVVDDCAHAFRYGLELAASGASVAFSLPKLFPTAKGGLLTRSGAALRPLHRDAEAAAWLSRYELHALVSAVQRRSQAHLANWRRLDAIARAHGKASVDEISAEVVPQVYRFKTRRQFAAQAVLRRHGVETTPPFYVGWLALPCHADLPSDYWITLDRAFDELADSNNR